MYRNVFHAKEKIKKKPLPEDFTAFTVVATIDGARDVSSHKDRNSLLFDGTIITCIY